MVYIQLTPKNVVVRAVTVPGKRTIMRRTTFFFLLVASAFVHIQGKTSEYSEAPLESVCTNDKLVEDDAQSEIVSEIAKPHISYRRNNVERSTNRRSVDREASCERRQDTNGKRRSVSTRERTRRNADRITRDVQTEVVQRERRNDARRQITDARRQRTDVRRQTTDARRQNADTRIINDGNQLSRRVRNTDRHAVEENTNRRNLERVDDKRVSVVRQTSQEQRTRSSMDIDGDRLSEERNLRVRTSEARQGTLDKRREADYRKIRQLSPMQLSKADYRDYDSVSVSNARVRRSRSRMDDGSSRRDSKRASDRRNVRSYSRNERNRDDRFQAVVGKPVSPSYDNARRIDVRRTSPQRQDDSRRDYIAVSHKTSERNTLDTPRSADQQRRRERSSTARSIERRNLSKARRHAPSKLPDTHSEDTFDFFTMTRALAVGAVALLGTNMWTKTV